MRGEFTQLREDKHEHGIFDTLRPAIPETSQAPQAQGPATQDDRGIRARAIRRIGKRFEGRIDHLTEPQLADYFTELMASHSWSAVKLDLYGLKFYYEH